MGFKGKCFKINNILQEEKEPSPNVLKSLKQLDDGSIFTFSFPQRENSLPFQRDSEALGRYPPFLPEQDDRNEGN